MPPLMPPPQDLETVPVEKAKAMLDVQDGYVHTIRISRDQQLMIGADWEEAEVHHALETSAQVYFTEGALLRMDHGLVVIDAVGPVFLATKPPTRVDKGAADGAAS